MKGFHFTDPMNQALRDLLSQRALRVAAPGESFTLSTGKQSTFFFNCKPVTLSSDGAALVADAFLDVLDEFPGPIDAVGGLTVGADPIVVSMVIRGRQCGKNFDGFLVRGEQKAHGLKDRVANAPRRGTRVVVVDDVVTTGRSTLEAIAAAKEIGCEVVGVIVLMDRLEDNGATNIKAQGLHYRAIFTRNDFPEIGGQDCPTAKSGRRSALTASS